jgi:hypothetical protein
MAAGLSLNHCASGVANNVSRKLAGAFGGEDSRDARQVHRDSDIGPPMPRIEKLTDVFGGIES